MWCRVSCHSAPNLQIHTKHKVFKISQNIFFFLRFLKWDFSWQFTDICQISINSENGTKPNCCKKSPRNRTHVLEKKQYVMFWLWPIILIEYLRREQLPVPLFYPRIFRQCKWTSYTTYISQNIEVVDTCALCVYYFSRIFIEMLW